MTRILHAKSESKTQYLRHSINVSTRNFQDVDVRSPRVHRASERLECALFNTVDDVAWIAEARPWFVKVNRA